MLAADFPSTVAAISSLVGTFTVAYVAIDARRTVRRTAKEVARADTARNRTERKVDAVARTTAATAVGVASVGGKVDANTTVTEKIHTEVLSINGSTPTELLEANEGRRVEADIAEEDRTHGEQGYVDRLHDGDGKVGTPDES